MNTLGHQKEVEDHHPQQTLWGSEEGEKKQ